MNPTSPHNQGPEHFCSSAKELKEPTKLLPVADDYLKAVCELAVRANDSTSATRMDQLERALKFAREVTRNGLSF